MDNTSVQSSTECSGRPEILDELVKNNSDSLPKINNLSTLTEEYLMSEIDTQNLNLYPNELDDIEEELLEESDDVESKREILSAKENAIGKKSSACEQEIVFSSNSHSCENEAIVKDELSKKCLLTDLKNNSISNELNNENLSEISDMEDGMKTVLKMINNLNESANGFNKLVQCDTIDHRGGEVELSNDKAMQCENIKNKQTLSDSNSKKETENNSKNMIYFDHETDFKITDSANNDLRSKTKEILLIDFSDKTDEKISNAKHRSENEGNKVSNNCDKLIANGETLDFDKDMLINSNIENKGIIPASYNLKSKNETEINTPCQDETEINCHKKQRSWENLNVLESKMAKVGKVEELLITEKCNSLNVWETNKIHINQEEGKLCVTKVSAPCSKEIDECLNKKEHITSEGITAINILEQENMDVEMELACESNKKVKLELVCNRKVADEKKTILTTSEKEIIEMLDNNKINVDSIYGSNSRQDGGCENIEISSRIDNIEICESIVNEIVDASIKSTEFLEHHNISKKINSLNIVSDILNDVVDSIFDNNRYISITDNSSQNTQNSYLEINIKPELNLRRRNSTYVEESIEWSKESGKVINVSNKLSDENKDRVEHNSVFKENKLDGDSSIANEEEMVTKNVQGFKLFEKSEGDLVASLILEDILSKIGNSNAKGQLYSSLMEEIMHTDNFDFSNVVKQTEDVHSIVLSIIDDILWNVCGEKEYGKSCSLTNSSSETEFKIQNTDESTILGLPLKRKVESVELIPVDVSRRISSSVLNNILSDICDENNAEESAIYESMDVLNEKMEYDDSLCHVLPNENISLLRKEEGRMIVSSLLDNIISGLCDGRSESENTLEESAVSEIDEVVNNEMDYEESLVCVLPKQNIGLSIKEECRLIAPSTMDDILSSLLDNRNEKENYVEESAVIGASDMVYNKVDEKKIMPNDNIELSVKENGRLIASSLLGDILSSLCYKKNEYDYNGETDVSQTNEIVNEEMHCTESLSYVTPHGNSELSMKEEGQLIATSILDEIFSGVCIERTENSVPLKEFIEEILNDVIKVVVKDDDDDDYDSNSADDLIDWNCNEYNEDTSSPILDTKNNINYNQVNIWKSEAEIIDILSNIDDPKRLEKVGFVVDSTDKREEFKVDVVLNHPNFQEDELISEISSSVISLDIIDEIIANATYYKVMKRKSEDHSYYQLSKIPRKETETGIVVDCVVDDILSTIFEKHEIVTDILDEIINKAVDSVENRKKKRKYQRKQNKVNMPLILDTKTISAETFNNLQGPVRQSSRIRTKVVESFDFTAAVIKEEPEDYIEINMDEVDIKPVLPLPEEIQAMAAQKLKKQKKPVVKRNQRKAQSVTRPPKKVVESPPKKLKTILPVKKKVKKPTSVPKVNPIMKTRTAALPRAAKASAKVLLKFDLSKVNWNQPVEAAKLPNQKKSKNEEEPTSSKGPKIDNEVVMNRRVKRDISMSPVRKYPPSKKIKILSPKPKESIPVAQVTTRQKHIILSIPPPPIEKPKRTSPVVVRKSFVVPPPSPPKRKAPAIKFIPPEPPAPKIPTARKSTSLPPKVLSVSPVRARTLPLILRRSPGLSRNMRSTPTNEVVEDKIVVTPPKRKVLYITPGGVPIPIAPTVSPKRSVAVKSTATRPIHVARKRGKLYVKPKEALFENFDSYENESNKNYYDSEYNACTVKTSDKSLCETFNISPCLVRLERNPYIDHLLPNKGKSREAICELCEPKRFFISKDGLVEHLKKEHNDTFSSGPSTSAMPSGNRCSGCDKKYFSQNRLSMHMRNCPALSAMSSNLSIVPYPSSSSSKPVEEELRHNCEVCGAKFSIWSAFKAHQKTHVQEDHDPLNLEAVEEGSSRKFKSVLLRRGPGLVMKFRREKEPDVPVPTISQCNICHLAFHYQADLERHRLTHVRIKEERLSPEVEILEEFLVKRPIGVPEERTVPSPTFTEPIVKAPTARKSTGGPRPAEKIIYLSTSRRKQQFY